MENELKTNGTQQRINVLATPAKSFFVHTITRDIELQDAILDLLDNCIDGIARSIKEDLLAEKPYANYRADIYFDENSFTITDNCGGIPIKLAENYAFRMGRPEIAADVGRYAIGTYGIGMKRALFKMGRKITVKSQHQNSAFKLYIGPEWLEDDADWKLYLDVIQPFSESDGTRIEVESLYPHISEALSDNHAFSNDLKKAVSSQYSFIINKGFAVYVKEEIVEPRPLGLKWTKEEFKGAKYIAPYLWQAEIEGVDIKLAIGFYREMPDEEELIEDEIGTRKSELAGWTIVCNDRIVLYCDKTKLTGWGDAGVPNYHTQFIALSGVVIFSSTDPSKLPLTTTKRGIDAGNAIYLTVKNIMRDGLKYFTDYTNKWKGREKEEKRISKNADLINIIDSQKMFATIPAESWQRTTKIPGKIFKPPLPLPKEENLFRQIRYSRPINDIRTVALHLFDDEDRNPGDVGAACFDMILKEALKK